MGPPGVNELDSPKIEVGEEGGKGDGSGEGNCRRRSGRIEVERVGLEEGGKKGKKGGIGNNRKRDD